MKIHVLKYLLSLSLLLFIALTGCNDDEEDVLTKNPTDPDNGGSVPTAIVSRDILSAEKYDRMIVEIQYAAGFEPPTGALDHLRNFLQARLNKPGGITFVSNEIAAPGKATYTPEDIRNIEKENRTQYSEGNTLATYFFFADGGYSHDTEESKVLGIAYGSTSMALFQKTIEDFSGGLTQPSAVLLTSTVMNHEFSHILGLVNNGTPIQSEHQDTAHGKHCNVQECLMYWAAETSQGLEDLLGLSSPPPLDAQCIADLKANGGK